MTECQCDEVMMFTNGHIGGDPFLTGSHISADAKGSPLEISGSVIGHNLLANSDGKVHFRCDRAILGIGLQVGGNIELNGAQLTCLGDALRLDVATIKGELFLQAKEDLATGKLVPFTCNGSISFPHIHIGQDIHADGAVFNCKGIALDMTNAEVLAGYVSLNDIKCAGSFRFNGARIGDGLYLKGAKFESATNALKLDDAVIGKYFTLERFESRGSVSMYGGAIDGPLNCTGAKLDSLALVEVHITQNVLASGSTFTSIGNAAVNFVSTQVDGTVDFSDVTSSAFFRFVGCKIKDPLTLAGAKINVGPSKYAVYLEGVELGGSLRMYGDFETEGVVDIEGGSIAGNVSCVGAKMQGLRLVRVHVTGDLYWFGIKNAQKTDLDLDGSSVHSLYDDRASWPGYGFLTVTDFTYHSLELRKSPTPDQLKDVLIPNSEAQTADARIEWLKRQGSNVIAHT